VESNVESTTVNFCAIVEEEVSDGGANGYAVSLVDESVESRCVWYTQPMLGCWFVYRMC
jgi:hypothetical protein